MAVFFMAFSNLKSKKGVAVSMGLLILLASAMLNVGLTLFAGIGSFYDKENERLLGAHYMVRFAGNEYSEDYLDYLKQDKRVEAAQTEEAVLMDMAQFPQGGMISVNFKRIDKNAPIQGYVLTKEAEVPENEAVYIPSFMREMGYEPGAELVLNFNKQEYAFRVAGYSQSTWLNSSVSSLVNIYMTDSSYTDLFSKLGGGYLLSVRVKDPALTEQVRRDFKAGTDVRIEAVTMDAGTMDFSVDEMKNGNTMMVTVLSTVLFAFSFLIVAVAVLVTRFRILNHIDQQMTNIGAMQAMGYTGGQIQWSIALEFLMISLAASLLGIVSSYGVIAALGHLIANSVGVSWRSGGYSGFACLSILAVVGLVLLAAAGSASRAAKLQPVDALRGGVKTHSFRKNYFPLERFGGRLVPALGIKHFFYQIKLYVMVGVIFSGIAFAGAFAVIIWQNMGMDDRLMLRMTGYEISDIVAYAAPHADYGGLRTKIEATDGVRKTSFYEAESIRVGEELLTCYVSDDFSRLEMVDVYEGNLPQYDNEIVVTGVLADSWDKKIGDTVEVSVSGSTYPYVICGLAQTMSNFGRQCFMSMDGMLRLNPNYTRKSVQIYLESGRDVEAQIREMETRFRVISPSYEETETDIQDPAERAKRAAAKKAEEKLAVLLSMYGADSAQYALMVDGELLLSGDTGDYEIERLENNRALFISNVNSFAASAGLMSVMILAGTGCMIALVFYMVIKSMLVRRKKEFGIYKAIGYTDGQLMRMIALSFLPAALPGVLAGCTVSCLSVGPLASALFKTLGVSRLSLAVSPFMVGGMGMCILAFSYLVSITAAGGIKKITVYGLLTEE